MRSRTHLSLDDHRTHNRASPRSTRPRALTADVTSHRAETSFRRALLLLCWVVHWVRHGISGGGEVVEEVCREYVESGTRYNTATLGTWEQCWRGYGGNVRYASSTTCTTLAPKI
jgi:hypothetical protein